jgi:hypothetical protein
VVTEAANGRVSESMASMGAIGMGDGSIPESIIPVHYGSLAAQLSQEDEAALRLFLPRAVWGGVK